MGDRCYRFEQTAPIGHRASYLEFLMHLLIVNGAALNASVLVIYLFRHTTFAAYRTSISNIDFLHL